jgi:sodium transport system permease protein
VNAAIVFTIFRKELTETLRDRRTLFAMFVLPTLIHPLIFLGLGQMTATEIATRRSLEPKAAVWGVLPPEIGVALHKEIGLSVVERREAAPDSAAKEARALLHSGRVQLVLGVEPDAEGALKSDGGATLEVWYDSVNHLSDAAHARLEEAVRTIGQRELKARLERRALPARFARPINLADHDLASRDQRAADLLGRMIPVIFLLVMVTCGLLPATDLTAGEKERGTLQTLLCSPVTALEIVAGKYLTVVLVALTGAAANLAAMGLALSRQLVGVDELHLQLSLSTAGLIFLSMMPAALLIAALILSVAVFARSFREAQSYLTPIVLVVLAASMVSWAPGLELGPGMAFVPLCNLVLLSRKLIAHEATPQIFFTVMVANLGYSLGALLLTARIFETEQVLISGEQPWRGLFGRRASGTISSPRGALLFVVVLLVLVYYGSLFADPQRLGTAGSLAAIQLGLFLLPAVLWARLGGVSITETFSLRLPTRRGLCAILLIASGAWAVTAILGRVEAMLFPGAASYAAELSRTLGPVDTRLLVCAAVLPAIAEEAAFRGVVLSGLGTSGSRRLAVVGSAVAFGLMHLNVYHVIVACALGLVLGFATLESGTILAGALAHLINNGLHLLGSRSPLIERLTSSPWAIAAGCAACGLGLWLVRSSRAPR